MNPQTDENTSQYYLDIWVGLLRQLLGWSELQVVQWAQDTGKMEYLADPDDIFYHQTPQYWIKNLVIPETLRNQLPNDERINLEARILEAFKDEHNFHFPPETNWTPYRARIEKILSEYGEHLPEVSGE